MNYSPRYSGPVATGICTCGCSWEDHHLCMVMNKEYTEQTGEAYIPDECDKYGFNEVGGMKYNEETKEWEDHCHGYRDSGIYCRECGRAKADGHKMDCSRPD